VPVLLRFALPCMFVGSCAPPPRALPPQVALTIKNATSDRVCDVFIRPSEQHAAGWGQDWLDRDEFVAPALTRRFQLQPARAWDVRVVSCGGSVLHESAGTNFVKDTDLTVSGTPN
jgi:hypothetical protein